MKTIETRARDKATVNLLRGFKKKLASKNESGSPSTLSKKIIDSLTELSINELKEFTKNKGDINILVHDPSCGISSEKKFSIKLFIGSQPTLFNANKDGTNFVYEIKGIDKTIAKEINQVKKFQGKFEALKKHSARIKFVEPAGKILNSNLVYVDYCLPSIVSDIVLLYYSTLDSSISDIVDIITEKNSLGFDYSYNQDFYEHKIKRLLTDIALGLKPGKAWKGKYEATGGYLIVKEDGEVICYHIYDKNQFEDYLFNNTRLDTPSTGRHKFGNIFEKDGRFYIKLNLQIRF